MANLEPLQSVARLGLLSHNIKDGVEQLSALGVVPLSPVVASTRLPENKIVRAEDLAVRTRAHGVHGAWLQVDQNGARHVAAARCLIVVHVDALQLKVRLAAI